MNRGQQVSTLTSLLVPESAGCVTVAPPAGGPPELHVEDVEQQDQDGPGDSAELLRPAQRHLQPVPV